MRIKFSWETSIILAFSFFIIFIIYIAFFFPHVGSQLISDRYYEEELKYQEIINEKKNVLKLPNKIKIFILSSGIRIIFPEVLDNIHGFFTLLRFSSKYLDVTRSFKIFRSSSKTLFIPKKKLKKGCYKLIIRWKSDKKKYFFEKNLFWLS
ncbi:cytochrome C oxidase Cbb3 [Blattabacterium punctulatus]|uniref:FixH family protein n=1 Tax=Blattabacterium punctulatus TaxID=164514 RepID=UPI000D7BD570|nr:FixH family protein [Blattabacterium punctulatus]AWU40469.1 cytochrome C oxidase Cbb3 [Blattabacterium punctulatus]